MQQRFRLKQAFARMLADRRPVGGNKLRRQMAEYVFSGVGDPITTERAVPVPVGFIDARPLLGIPVGYVPEKLNPGSQPHYCATAAAIA